MDDICPPSTVYAAYNAWHGAKEISVWPYNRHEGGGSFQTQDKLRFMQRIMPL
jgi:cephalosporin-C deacetylase